MLCKCSVYQNRMLVSFPSQRRAIAMFPPDAFSYRDDGRSNYSLALPFAGCPDGVVLTVMAPRIFLCSPILFDAATFQTLRGYPFPL